MEKGSVKDEKERGRGKGKGEMGKQ